jgi:periplasmic copper chaperone A
MSACKQRRRILGLGAALGGCALIRPVRACEFATVNFIIVHPWTRASAPAASTAVVGMRLQDVVRDDQLLGASTPVAEAAELVGADGLVVPGLAIPAQRITVLGESGPQLRLLGLRWALQQGREYPLQLHFADAGVVNSRLSVDYTRFA